MVVAKVSTSRRTDPSPSTRRTAATTVSLCTSSPAQRGCRTSISASFRIAPSAQAPEKVKSEWRAPGRQAPAATQARVLRGARVQLIRGFHHTKDRPDLSADGDPTMPQVSSLRVREVGGN